MNNRLLKGDEQAERLQALARVYALLIHLVEDKESANVHVVDSGAEDHKEVIHEMQSKKNKRASLPSPGKKRQ